MINKFKGILNESDYEVQSEPHQSHTPSVIYDPKIWGSIKPQLTNIGGTCPRLNTLPLKQIFKSSPYMEILVSEFS